MNIRDRASVARNLWDWEFLNPAFDYENTKIRPCDVDGIVSRKGNILVLEGKPDPDGKIRTGQAILMNDLAAHGITVLVLYGKPGEPTHMQVWSAEGDRPRVPVSEEDVVRWVREWFVWADANPRRVEAVAA